MLIENYDLEVFTPPCEPGAERFAARARLTTDISEILPYLNATLRGAVYHPTATALTWKKGGHNIAFHAFEIATSNVEDRDGAEKELEGLVDLVNRTWEQRTEITPDTTTHQRPTPMAIFKLLPQTNCKQCGEPTCYTFALKLATAQKKLANCPPLAEPQYAEKLAGLEAIIIDAPTISLEVTHMDKDKDETSTPETQTPGKPPLCTCVKDPFSDLPPELRPRPKNVMGPVHKVTCPGCGLVYWTNRNTELCIDCEKKSLTVTA